MCRLFKIRSRPQFVAGINIDYIIWIKKENVLHLKINNQITVRYMDGIRTNMINFNASTQEYKELNYYLQLQQTNNLYE